MRAERFEHQLGALAADVVEVAGACSVVEVDADARRVLDARHQTLVRIISVLVQNAVEQVITTERL